MAVDVDIDFTRDWLELLRVEVENRGYQVPGDRDKLGIHFFDLARRELPARRWCVERARELDCPAGHRAALDEIAAKATAGESLKPYLSRGLKRFDYSDQLLNDWGLHHLHLGTELEADGHVKRTGPVLLAQRVGLRERAGQVARLHRCFSPGTCRCRYEIV